MINTTLTELNIEHQGEVSGFEESDFEESDFEESDFEESDFVGTAQYEEE